MRPGLVSVKVSQEKFVGGLLKKGKTASTTQMTSMSTLIQSANRRKYSVSDTFDPANRSVHGIQNASQQMDLADTDRAIMRLRLDPCQT